MTLQASHAPLDFVPEVGSRYGSGQVVAVNRAMSLILVETTDGSRVWVNWCADPALRATVLPTIEFSQSNPVQPSTSQFGAGMSPPAHHSSHVGPADASSEAYKHFLHTHGNQSHFLVQKMKEGFQCSWLI